MSGLAIDVRGLRKSYGAVEAVRGIDLQVETGEIFALLGPNGAGKTTTVEILEGYRERDAGDVGVLGYDPARGEREFRARIGIVLQQTAVDPYLTVAETIDLYRGYFPHPRPVDEIIDLVGLEEKRNVRGIKLSGGQQRRLDVAIGLAGDPDLLFLDEPTTGFDPSARRNAWQMIKNLKSIGKSVLLTTHYMDEAQHLSDRVAIIVGGKIVTEGRPGSLGDRDIAPSRIEFRLAPGVSLPDSVAEHATLSDGIVQIQTKEPTKLLHELTGWAVSQGLELEGLLVAQPSLEDVYLDVTEKVQ